MRTPRCAGTARTPTPPRSTGCSATATPIRAAPARRSHAGTSGCRRIRRRSVLGRRRSERARPVARTFDAAPRAKLVEELFEAPHTRDGCRVLAPNRFYCLILSGGQGRAVLRGMHTGTVAEVEENIRALFRVDRHRLDAAAAVVAALDAGTCAARASWRIFRRAWRRRSFLRLCLDADFRRRCWHERSGGAGRNGRYTRARRDPARVLDPESRTGGDRGTRQREFEPGLPARTVDGGIWSVSKARLETTRTRRLWTGTTARRARGPQRCSRG